MKKAVNRMVWSIGMILAFWGLAVIPLPVFADTVLSLAQDNSISGRDKTAILEEKIKTLEEQMNIFHKQLEDLKKEQSQNKNRQVETQGKIGEISQEIEKVRDEATLEKGAEVHGNGDIWLRHQDQPGTGQWAFRAHEIELGFYKKFGNKMYGLVEVEFENKAAGSTPTAGVNSNLNNGNQINIEEYFVHYDLAKNQYLRAGLQPIMFSRFMNIRYPHRNPLVSSPTTFTGQTIGLKWFDTGISYFGTTDPDGILPTGLSAGLAPIGRKGSFDWWASLTNTTPGGKGFRDKLSQSQGNKNITYSASVGYVPVDNLHLGVSYASGSPFAENNSRRDNNRTLLGYSLDWQKIGDRFNLLGEYVVQDTQVLAGKKEKDYSWYVMGMYELPQKFDLIARYDNFKSNYSSSDNFSTISLGLRRELYRKGFSRAFLKLEWRKFNYTSLAEGAGKKDFNDIFSSIGFNF